jgi:hypothetical protein
MRPSDRAVRRWKSAPLGTTPAVRFLGPGEACGAGQLPARRYETASSILTSKKAFDAWGEIFGDDVMAGALIDRLLHHCQIVNIRGNSYRRQHDELWPALHPPDDDNASAKPRRP